jgi:hypothetical protein
MLACSILLIALSIVTFNFNSSQQEIEIYRITDIDIQTNNNNDHQNNEDNQISEAGKEFIDFLKSTYTDDVKMDAIYIDGSESLDEMLQKADIIVKGTVNEVEEERLFGIFFSFDIEQVIKGDYKKDDTITVLTSKGKEQLEVGETYVLVLDHDSYYDEDTFHVMAGGQGRFSLEGEKIKYKEIKFKDDIDKIMSDNSNKDLSPLDKLCNDFTTRVMKQDE